MCFGNLERLPVLISSSNLNTSPLGGQVDAHVSGRLPDRPRAEPLVTSRNNSYLFWKDLYDTPLVTPRPYVQKCGKGTLGLLYGTHVTFSALTCGSWSCPNCRKVLAARLLDRLRRGMETRSEYRRSMVTLTLDPSKFGAVRIGQAGWDQEGNSVPLWKAVRRTTLWSQPTPEQFKAATEAMSKEWDKLNLRLSKKCRNVGVQRFGYFRVVELHRNCWPHYHVLLEHPELTAVDVDRQLQGWSLGRVDVSSDISLDDAVGEMAPYLVCNERKSGGHKAYQFAGKALPKNFRLYSQSKGFLAAPVEPEIERPEHSQVLTGHFTLHHESARHWGADTRIVLNAPTDPDRPHRPPGTSLATGDAATLYYLELFAAKPLHLTSEEEEAVKSALSLDSGAAPPS